MTPTLPNKTNSPPGGWRYRVPQTGQLFTGVSEHQLLVQLEHHYRATGYTKPTNLKELVEEFICSAIPDYCTGNEPARPVGGFSFHTVIQGTRTIGSWLLSSFAKGARQYVPQAQADARASVCATGVNGGSCPFNDQPEGCTGCNSGAMKETLRFVVGDRHTAFDNQLKSCRVCNCGLFAKVHLPHAVLWDNMPLDQRAKLPDWCWLVKEAAL